MPVDFRPITELCQFEMTDEERQLCNRTVEDWVGKLKGYCFTTQQTDPTDPFCLTALPPPTMRTQNILGEDARTSRFLVVPQLPADFGDLPDMLQDAIDEDQYTAIMEDRKLTEADTFRRWLIDFFVGPDFGGISSSISASGGGSSPINHGDSTKYLFRIGGGFDFGCRFGISEVVDLFASLGGEMDFSYASGGGDLFSWLGRARLGLVLTVSDSSSFEVAAITKLGYTESNGSVYHPSVGHVDLSYMDGGAGASLAWMWQGESLRAGFAIEGLYNFLQDHIGGVSVAPFPIPFFMHLRLGWRL